MSSHIIADFWTRRSLARDSTRFLEEIEDGSREGVTVQVTIISLLNGEVYHSEQVSGVRVVIDDYYAELQRGDWRIAIPHAIATRGNLHSRPAITGTSAGIGTMVEFL